MTAGVARVEIEARFLALQSALAASEALWRPAPFHVRRPGWCEARPALAAAVLALDDAALEHFIAEPAAAHAWLSPRLPEMAALTALASLPVLPARALAAAPRGFESAIPAAKRGQIEAFARHFSPGGQPLLEWCAGKGHLGRRLGQADGVAVTSLELEPELCQDGTRLARKQGVAQQMVQGDALAPASRGLLGGRAVVALHACGELHRQLVRHAADDGARAYAIAPCCYYRGADAGYRALGAAAALPLSAAELRMAVTETVTAPAGVRRRLARDQAWKLGFKALCAGLGLPAPATFRPVPAAWLAGRFEDFCGLLALREGVVLPDAVDWPRWLAVGEQRRAELRRLELVRHAFRRPLEAWLVLDLALALQQAGFETSVGEFCARALTPRNLMVIGRAAR